MADHPALASLRQYAEEDRPAAVAEALRQLSRRTGDDLLAIAELAWEAHDRRYWSLVNRPGGGAYLSEEDFFEDVLRVGSWRTAFKRIALGRALAALPPERKALVSGQILDVGAAKAVALVPVIERAAAEGGTVAGLDLDAWFQRARELKVEELQRAVSLDLGAKPRGGRGAPDRAAAFLATLMPDIESRGLLEDFLAAGRRVTQGGTTVGILIEAMRECLASWLPKLPRGAESEADA